MKIDVLKLVGAVTREVKAAEREGKAARTIVASRIYETDIKDAWDALTSEARIPRWFLPIEGELKLGGRYQFVGNAGGNITACEAPRHVALTWEMFGDVSWVDVHLESKGAEQTLLILEHTAIIDDARWNEYGPGAVGVGWELGLLGLYLHFESKSADHTKEGQAWTMSDEGKQFQRLLSDEWGKASIAFGTDATKAREAAKRTATFYTGGD